jgi:hypothetical protein
MGEGIAREIMASGSLMRTTFLCRSPRLMAALTLLGSALLIFPTTS